MNISKCMLWIPYLSTVTAEYNERFIARDGFTIFEFEFSKELEHNRNRTIPDWGVFPVSVASLLVDTGIEHFTFTVLQGRPNISGEPSGSVLRARLSDGTQWERLLHGISGLVGSVSLETDSVNVPSYDFPEEKRRILHIPQSRPCTHHLLSLIGLLPCRDISGVGKVMSDRVKDIVSAPWFTIKIDAAINENTLSFKATVTAADKVNTTPYDRCIFATSTENGLKGSEDLKRDQPNVSVTKLIKSISMTRVEITYHIKSPAEEEIEIINKLPKFLIPLSRTITSSEECNVVKSSISSFVDGWEVNLKMKPSGTCLIFFSVEKRILSLRDFDFAANTGFHLSGALYKTPDMSEYSVTNGCIVDVFVTDGSMPYNTMAIVISIGWFIYNLISKSLVATRTEDKVKAD